MSDDRSVPPVFPFIVGCGRSGTTLLRAMLDSHPLLAIPPESYFVVPMLRASPAVGSSPAGITQALERAVGGASFGEWGLSPETAKQAVLATRPGSVAEALSALYRHYAATRGKPIAGDKTPYHVRHVALLAGYLPTARFIHIIRDGRDVVPSLMAMPFGPDRFERAVLYWKRDVEAGRHAGRSIGPDRYLEVRYEELVADPSRVLTQVTTFLGLDFDKEMLAYHRRSEDVLSGLRRSSHLRGVAQPPVVGLRDWRIAMNPDQLARFEALAGHTLAALGYDPGPVPSNVPRRATALVWAAIDTTLRLGGRGAFRLRRRLWNGDGAALVSFRRSA